MPQNTMSDYRAPVQELFNSLQGEGILAGIRQVFLRFQGCNLHCNYCDTPTTHSRDARYCRIEHTPGQQDFTAHPTPLTAQETAEWIEQLWTPSTKHLCLTGGEPLLHTHFIHQLSKNTDHPLYLETNSSLPEAAASIAELIDTAACDIKLREHQATSNYETLLNNTLETLQILHNTTRVFIKIIILPTTTTKTLTPILKAVADIDTNIPLILQPLTPHKPQMNPPAHTTLLELMDTASEHLEDVRAIPQIHKMLKIP